MTDQDYIRKAVELADGFAPEALQVSTTEDLKIGFEEQFFLDALAAQLVRQVDVLNGHDIFVEPTCVKLGKSMRPGRETILFGATRIDGPDRTMNTIKAIVDSKVLE